MSHSHPPLFILWSIVQINDFEPSWTVLQMGAKRVMKSCPPQTDMVNSINTEICTIFRKFEIILTGRLSRECMYLYMEDADMFFLQCVELLSLLCRVAQPVPNQLLSPEPVVAGSLWT